MSRGMAFLTLAALLAWLPAAASQPEGLAGKIISNAGVPDDPSCITPGFQWYEFFGVTELNSDDTVTLEMAIIPFDSGVTSVGLDEGAFATTFVSLIFENGLVHGVPYRRFGWNDVTVEIRLASQDYLIKINGLTGGPFPFDSACAGGCFSAQAFRVSGGSRAGGDVAWIDSVALNHLSAGGSELLFGYSADPCRDHYPNVSGGGLVIAEFSPRERHGRCAGGAR